MFEDLQGFGVIQTLSTAQQRGRVAVRVAICDGHLCSKHRNRGREKGVSDYGRQQYVLNVLLGFERIVAQEKTKSSKAV